MIGILNLTRGFAELGHEVTVLSLNTKKHFFDLQQLPDDVKQLARFIAIDIDTTIRKRDALKNLFTEDSYNIERFYSKTYEEELRNLLREESFDIILLEGIYLMRYYEAVRETLRETGNTKTQVVLRPHNVEYKIWERLRDNEKNLLKRYYLNILAKRMKRFELSNIFRADAVVPVSKVDLDIFRSNSRSKTPAMAFPIGYVFDELPDFTAINEESAVAFIGGMDWLPNYEGIKWFLRDVWPQVLRQKKDAKFYLAGRNFPDDMKNMRMKGVRVLGEVQDAREFLLSKSICIVPLFAGSGMRVKIVEAMALGRAIVSTTVGAESIDYRSGKNIHIADSARNFATYITELLYHTDKRISMGKEAQQLVRESYDNRKLCKEMLHYLTSIRRP